MIYLLKLIVGANNLFKMIFNTDLKRFKVDKGFTLVELIIVVGMISTFSGLVLPSFLNWIRTEKVNSYTRELREYFRVVRLDARRWGSSCLVNINVIPFNGVQRDRNYYGYSVSCNDGSRVITSLAPPINNSIFQLVSKEFRITPNGRISSNQPVVIVIGSKHYDVGAKILNCLIIQTPTGHVIKGKFSDNNWLKEDMEVSNIDINNVLTPGNCKKS